MHYNCLIIDDEIDLAKVTKEYFELFDISCAVASCQSEALHFFDVDYFDLVLLDINLGDESGFELCKKIRETLDIPILFISARQSDDDVLLALNIGGDDYIKKPYSLSILLAKVKIVLKRSALQESAPKKNEVSSHIISIDRSTFTVIVEGKRIQLKAKEYALFECLYNRKNTIVSKEELFDEVWKDSFYSDGTLNVHIRKLREKIEENPNSPKYIKTIWGTGYMLEIADED